MTTRIAQIEAILECYLNIPFGTRASLSGIGDITASAGKRGFVDFSTISPDQPYLRTHKEAFKILVEASSLANLETIIDNMLTLQKDFTSFDPNTRSITYTLPSGDMDGTAYTLDSSFNTNDIKLVVGNQGTNYYYPIMRFSVPDLKMVSTINSAVLTLVGESQSGDPVYHVHGIKTSLLPLTSYANFITMLAGKTTVYGTCQYATVNSINVKTTIEELLAAGYDSSREIGFVMDEPESGGRMNLKSYEDAPTNLSLVIDYEIDLTNPYPYKLQVFEGQLEFDGLHWTCDFIIEGCWRVE